MSDDAGTRDVATVIDGGDRACGELLLVLAARLRTLDGGSTVRLIATDPAAIYDIPAWCHLTGHRYLGHGNADDTRAFYDIQTSATSLTTQARDPWRLHTSSSQ